MDGIRTVGLIGAGVIGGGWAARCLLNGYDVVLSDPDPEAERKIGAMLENARRALWRLTVAPLPKEGKLTIVSSTAEAVENADFVQESAPEREDLKIKLLAEASRAARPDVIFASSTSGLLPTRLQSEMVHPERFTVGHPFNPVYLMPLVEVCGGDKTSMETKEKAMAFYRTLGMHPLHVRKEIDGFIADRMMEALWREALWMVNDGVATAQEIDDAIRFGPGLRWSFMGTFLIYRIAGGEAGMRHFMAQFGPSLKWPWTKLMDVPELTEELLDTICAQSDEQSAGADLRALERLRDDCLVGIFQGLKVRDYGYGSDLIAYEKMLLDQAPPPALDPTRPLMLHRATVLPEWTDINGRMTEARTVEVFTNATAALLRYVGIDTVYVAQGHACTTVETLIRHLAPARAGARMLVQTQVLHADSDLLHLHHTLLREPDSERVATVEHMLHHVNTGTAESSPPRPDIARRIQALATAQAALPRPARSGRAIGMR